MCNYYLGFTRTSGERGLHVSYKLHGDATRSERKLQNWELWATFSRRVRVKLKP